MNKNNNMNLGFWTFVLLWFGAAVSMAEIFTGGLIAPLGLKIGIIVIIVGHLIGTGIFIFGGIIGTREKMAAITSTRLSFGTYGTYLFSILNILQLVGWTAVMIRSAAGSINAITKSIWGFNNIVLCSIAIGVLTAIWVWFGKAGMKKLNTVSVVLLLGLTIVMGFVIFRDSALLSNTATGSISFGGALELNVVMPLSWLPLIADYTRFAKTEKAGAWGSFIGYFLGSSWMFIIGLGAAIVSNNSDPSAMMLAANLGITALGIVVLSTVTTTFMDVYSAGVSFLNIIPKLKERNMGIIMSFIGTFIALIFPMENYEGFLYIIGSVFAPLFAVLIADYFVINKRNSDENTLLNWGAAVVWGLGVALYYVFIKLDLAIGATAPVMIITGMLQIITWRWTSKWKLTKKSQDSCAA